MESVYVCHAVISFGTAGQQSAFLARKTSLEPHLYLHDNSLLGQLQKNILREPLAIISR